MFTFTIPPLPRINPKHVEPPPDPIIDGDFELGVLNTPGITRWGYYHASASQLWETETQIRHLFEVHSARMTKEEYKPSERKMIVDHSVHFQLIRDLQEKQTRDLKREFWDSVHDQFEEATDWPFLALRRDFIIVGREEKPELREPQLIQLVDLSTILDFC